MATLYTLIGIPGSGKSTYANNMASKDKNIRIVSSDKVREELYGDESVQKDHNRVFSIVHKRIREYLKQGYDVIFDATNILPEHRKEAFNDGADCNIAVYFNTSFEECVRRNNNRKRKVPYYAMNKMRKKLKQPDEKEGYDCIYSML